MVKRSPYVSVAVIWSFAGISTLAPIGRFADLSDSPHRTPRGAFRGLSYQSRLQASGRDPVHHQLPRFPWLLRHETDAGFSPAWTAILCGTGSAAFLQHPGRGFHPLSPRPGTVSISADCPFPARTHSSRLVSDFHGLKQPVYSALAGLPGRLALAPGVRLSPHRAPTSRFLGLAGQGVGVAPPAALRGVAKRVAVHGWRPPSMSSP